MTTPEVAASAAHALLHDALFTERATLSVQSRVCLFGLWAQLHAASHPVGAEARAIPITEINVLTHRGMEATKDTPFILDAIAHVIVSHRPTAAQQLAAARDDSIALGLPEKTLVAYEAYVFTLFWPERITTRILPLYTITLPTDSVPPEIVVATHMWLCEIAADGLPDNATERALLDLFCDISTPLVSHIRFAHRSTAYQRYRDFDAEDTCPEFVPNINMAVNNLPQEVIANDAIRTTNPALFTCACLTIFKIYASIAFTKENTLVENRTRHTVDIYTDSRSILSNCTILCPPFSIFYSPPTTTTATDDPRFYIALPGDRLVGCTASAPALIFTYLKTIAPFFPTNKRIHDALARIHDITSHK